MTYSVKEIFYTLQGEGANTGRPAVFCRFTGCNLWTGREDDRPTAICAFCDTDFVGTNGDGGGKFDAAHELADTITLHWTRTAGQDPVSTAMRLVVLTGGEPLLQVDAALIDALHTRGFQIAVETNGSLEAPCGLDWICVSPKAGAPWRQKQGHELKLVYPQAGLNPSDLEARMLAGELHFEHCYLQAMDGIDQANNIEAAVAYCMKHPRWRLSLQTHKILSIR
ncbi:MAG: 7-carboxy-7-deazaguanine synthase [Leptothrix ochracea]|uniref:7-carboxy-7-deazaguanine synthase n=1 Tax=Leptothrix ochracea TaxID=735331 RepID=UPI0034E19FD5